MRVVAAGLWAALAFGQQPAAREIKFSHRLHLQKAGAQCLDCHASAAASTTASDRNLPIEKTCLRCHDGRRASRVDARAVTKLATARREIRFSHKLHLGFGSVAPALAAAIDSGKYLGPRGDIRRHLSSANPCVACHRGLHETDYSSRASLPQMADCLVCHSQIDAPFTCEKCHTAPAASLKPASHTPEYHDRHAKMQLDKPSCRVCHGTGFRCMGCH